MSLVTTWEVRRGSCLHKRTGLPSLPDQCVDVSISDPPYDEHVHTASRRGHTGYPERHSQRATFNRARDIPFQAIRREEMIEVAAQLGRVTRRWVGVFCSIEMVGDSAKDGGKGWRAAGENAGLEYVRTAAWRKLGATPQFTGDRPAIAFEAIVLFHPKSKRGKNRKKSWNGGGKHGWYDIVETGRDVYEHAIVINRGNGANRVHTTQKPLPLMKEIILDFTDPGEIVLDAYAGAGTTGVACRMLGRRFLGWELDKEMHALAQRRIGGDEAAPRPEQPSLFAPAPTGRLAL